MLALLFLWIDSSFLAKVILLNSPFKLIFDFWPKNPACALFLCKLGLNLLILIFRLLLLILFCDIIEDSLLLNEGDRWKSDSSISLILSFLTKTLLLFLKSFTFLLLIKALLFNLLLKRKKHFLCLFGEFAIAIVFLLFKVDWLFIFIFDCNKFIFSRVLLNDEYTCDWRSFFTRFFTLFWRFLSL